MNDIISTFIGIINGAREKIRALKAEQRKLSDGIKTASGEVKKALEDRSKSVSSEITAEEGKCEDTRAKLQKAVNKGACSAKSVSALMNLAAVCVEHKLSQQLIRRRRRHPRKLLNNIGLTTGPITPTEAADVIFKGWENLWVFYPQVNPVFRHRRCDPDTGTSSRFNADTWPSISDQDRISIEAGHGEPGDAYVIRVVANTAVGTYHPAPVPEAGTVRIVEDSKGHGVMAVPDENFKMSFPPAEETNEWSAVITRETLRSNNRRGDHHYYVLATAFPGPQDSTPNMAGLRVGDTISAEEARRRSIRVRV